MNEELRRGHTGGVKHVLLSDKRLEGKYVAVPDFGADRVVAFGSDPLAVKRSAVAAGFADPVVTYVPPSDMVHVY
ncbi:MAG: hypothetical protein HQK87_07315 [Nitrospinae bacterium]|nr:hypothetical protein [Nitrospinota bacterium]